METTDSEAVQQQMANKPEIDIWIHEFPMMSCEE